MRDKVKSLPHLCSHYLWANTQLFRVYAKSAIIFMALRIVPVYYFHILYMIENSRIIYDTSHVCFIPNTQKNQGSKAILYQPILPQITDFRSNRFRLYMLRVIKATRTTFFKRQVVKRMMADGRGRIRKVKKLEERFRENNAERKVNHKRN